MMHISKAAESACACADACCLMATPTCPLKRSMRAATASAMHASNRAATCCCCRCCSVASPHSCCMCAHAQEACASAIGSQELTGSAGGVASSPQSSPTS